MDETASAGFSSPYVARRIARLQYWATLFYVLPRAIEPDDLGQAAWLAMLQTKPDDMSAYGWACRWHQAWWAMVNQVRAGNFGKSLRGLKQPPMARWSTPVFKFHNFARSSEILLEDVVAAPEDGDQDLRVDLSTLSVQVLTKRQERIVAMYHVEGWTWNNIARKLRITKIEARHIAHTALNRLRKHLAPELPPLPELAPIGSLKVGKPKPLPMAQFVEDVRARQAANDRLWAMFHGQESR